MIHSGIVLAAESIWNGRGLITLDEGGLVRVWDLASSEMPVRRVVTGLDFHPKSFSSDGRLVSMAAKDGRTQVIDLTTDNRPGKLFRGNRQDASVFNADATRLLTFGSGHSQIWNVRTGERIATIEHESVSLNDAQSNSFDNSITYATFSPNGKFVATASRNGVARLWDASSGMPTSPPLKHSSSLSHVAFSPDSDRIVTSTGRLPRIAASSHPTGEVRVWTVPTGDLISPVLQHGSGTHVSWAEFSPDGQRVVTGCMHSDPKECAVRVWEVESAKQVAIMRHGRNVYQASFSADGKEVISISQDGTAQSWDASTGEPVNPPMRHKGGLCEMVVRNRILLTFADSGPEGYRRQLWDLRTGQPLTVPLGYGWGQAAISENAETLISSLNFGEIEISSIGIDNRSINEIRATAEVVSGYRIDAQSVRLPLTASDFHARFHTVLNNSPGYWMSSPEQVARWKVRKADWPRHLASQASKDGDLQEKIGRLNQVLKLLPVESFKGHKALLDRGRTFAMLGQWENALRDLNEANSILARPGTMCDVAQFYLRMGRLADHKRICSQMSQAFELENDIDAKFQLAMTGVLVAASIDDWDHLARQLTARNNPQLNRARAAVLYRAGKFDDSLKTFESVPEILLGAREYFFRAMAHAALGNGEEAKQMLAKAEEWIEANRQRMEKTHDWQGTLEIELLRKEARETIDIP